MSEDLKGQVAVVTGGTRGIGVAIARALLAEGVAVAVCGTKQSSVEGAVKDLQTLGRVEGRVCNVGSFEEVEGFFRDVEKTFGRLDILINNAGIGFFAPVDEITPEDWRRLIEINLHGPFYCTRQAVPLMKKNGGGFIINIGSLAGKNPFAGGSCYNASKFGLNGFSEAIMLDLRQHNIRVSQIMPGSVQTDFGPFGAAGGDWKIDPAHIGDTVLHLLRTPARSLASRIEMRPSRPPSK